MATDSPNHPTGTGGGNQQHTDGNRSTQTTTSNTATGMSSEPPEPEPVVTDDPESFTLWALWAETHPVEVANAMSRAGNEERDDNGQTPNGRFSMRYRNVPVSRSLGPTTSDR